MLYSCGYSTTEITEEQYEYIANACGTITIWKLFVTFWYGINNRDVVLFLEAIDKMCELWQDRNIDMFKDGVSVPGITMKYLFSNIPKV